MLLKILKKIKNILYHKLIVPIKICFFLRKYPKSSPGTVEWFIGTEIRYGGYITNVKRNKVSPRDPRSEEIIKTGGMTGGDRMLHHGYATKYSEYLLPYVHSNKQVTLVEVGILMGTGLAIWCDLFPKGRIYGFDIDLTHINRNLSKLKSKGAFSKNRPELYEYDQFLDNYEYLGSIFKHKTINICIDDGFHSDEAILTTMKSFLPYLAYDFIYFVEDNETVSKKIKLIYPNFNLEYKDKLTIVSKKE